MAAAVQTQTLAGRVRDFDGRRARGAGVTGPAAAPDVRGPRSDVSGNDMGLDLVAFRLRPWAGVVDGVQQGEKRVRLVAGAGLGEGGDGPLGGVTVLPAVLAD